VLFSTANLEFSTTESSKQFFLADSNIDRQPEVDAITGNAYSYETATYGTEIHNELVDVMVANITFL